MFSLPQTANARYTPLYFLSALGAGGLAVTFFMYLMFWVPHPDQPVPVFEDIARAWATGNAPMQAAIAVAMIGIALFAALHLRLMVWNFGQMTRFRQSDGFDAYLKTNAASQLLAQPLALAMSVNVGFILGLVFVPNLWSVVEYLFPFALIAFLLIGLYALRLLGGFLTTRLAGDGLNCAANNSFAQMLPGFALAMVAVGLAAPAALSSNTAVAGIALILATFFMVVAVIAALSALILGLRSMMEHGVAAESAPTLLIVIPLVTVLSIAWVRLSHGMHVHFDGHTGAATTLWTLTTLLSVQVVFALFGLAVLRAVNYADRFLTNAAPSVGAYALVCPGVALNVMLFFWINKGLVATGLVAKFGVAYWTLTSGALALQVAMIGLVLFLNRQHFGRLPQGAATA